MDDDLEHGWTGNLEIELGNERPSTGLGHDPSARKWILGGVGASCLLTAAFVLLATHDVTPAHAAAIDAPPEPSSELAPAPSEVNPAQPSSKADSTLAAGSSAAVQTKPRAAVTPKAAAKPEAAASKPAVTAPKPAATAPKPAATASKPAPTASKPAPTVSKPAPTVSKPAATASKPAGPKPALVEPDETPKLPSEPSPAGSNGELPDVEAWDEADDEASIDEATVPATPS